MKVAVLHYWFVSRRGGEKVVESILKLFPDADIYTLFYDKKKYGRHLENHNIYTSVLNIPFFTKRHHQLFPLYPLGVKSLKLKKKYDLIISSESGPIKGIKNPYNIPHLCYIHSPMRYCWGFSDEYLRTVSKPLRPLIKILFERLRQWDKTTINHVDFYIANSKNVAKRVKTFYNREAKVIYPPISNEFFNKTTISDLPKEFFLSFGAMTPYKRIDLLVETFNMNKKPLVIIGEGSEKKALMKKAKSNIVFKGNLPWEEIEKIFAKSKLLIFPGEEDFGMIPLEVMAYGIPVLAYKKGGALETVVENEKNIKKSTGLFFDEQTPQSLNKGIEKFLKNEPLFDANSIKKHAEQFKDNIFQKKMTSAIDSFLNKT